MAQKSKEQQLLKLKKIAELYKTNQDFKKQVDTLYAKMKQKADESQKAQIALVEQLYGEELAKILYAYNLSELLELQLANKPKQLASGLPVYNLQTQMARMGTKFDYISRLNGHCPEGYEVEKYLTGGCVKCKKGRLMLLQLQLSAIKVKPRFEKCGGKAKKKEVGGTLNTSWMTNAATTNKGKNIVKADKCGGKTKKYNDGGIVDLKYNDEVLPEDLFSMHNLVSKRYNRNNNGDITESYILYAPMKNAHDKEVVMSESFLNGHGPYYSLSNYIAGEVNPQHYLYFSYDNQENLKRAYNDYRNKYYTQFHRSEPLKAPALVARKPVMTALPIQYQYK